MAKKSPRTPNDLTHSPAYSRTYVRRSWSDTWHWIPECQHYPTRAQRPIPATVAYNGTGVRPSYGELCNVCRKLEL